MGIGRIEGFELDAAEDQSAVVMQGAAEAKLESKRFTCPPALGQGPAAGGVEEIPLQHPLPVDPELGSIRPPAQHQASAGGAGAKRAPTGRAVADQPQAPPEASAGPDDQAARRPVGSMAATPGILKGTGRPTIAPRHPPVGLEVEG